MKAAHEFEGLHKDLGIKTSSLGCLMLNTENPLSGLMPEEGQYVSENPELWWIKGLLKDWHVTVRYGFLDGVKRAHVERVIADLKKPDELIPETFDIFPSTYPEENYECVVLRVGSLYLENLHKQLSVLPNVETFPEYKPHITIGYFEPGWFENNLGLLWNKLKPIIKTADYDFGKNL